MSTTVTPTPDHEKLLQEAMRWAAGSPFEPALARHSRREVLRRNHRYYRHRIPLYRQIADRAGVNDEAPFEVLAHEMLLPDVIFKSYPQSLLDKRDFAGMNEEWLKWFPCNPPARQGAKLAARIPGLKDSIAAIAEA